MILAGTYAVTVAGFYAVVAWRTRAGDPDTLATSVPDVGLFPGVSIILPARNEQRNIRDCVETLLAQDYPDYEVIVVNDGSDDDTGRILSEVAAEHAQRERLRVLSVESLPPGWAGKPHALQTGAAAATGEWLLFTDADTRHERAALRSAVASAVARSADLLTLGTQQDTPDFWSRVLMPFAYMGIGMMYPLRKVGDPNSPVAIANGQFILIRRGTYDAVGGYASPSLRGSIVDDRDLAAVVKRIGGRIALVDGRDLVHVRMYHTLAEHWEGWGKNAFAGSRGGLPFYALMLIGLPTACIAPFALMLALPVLRRRDVAMAGVPAVAATLLYRAKLNRDLGVPLRYIWTHPLAAAIFTGILARSAWRVLTRQGVTWRGRTYQV